jgi:hypothetical protein
MGATRFLLGKEVMIRVGCNFNPVGLWAESWNALYIAVRWIRFSGSHGPGTPALGNGCIQSCPEFGEAGRGAHPAQLVHIFEERDVSAEGGERAKEQRALPLAGESGCEDTRVGGIHVPLATVWRDGFEM